MCDGLNFPDWRVTVRRLGKVHKANCWAIEDDG
jgi:hypothetical protein